MIDVTCENCVHLQPGERKMAKKWDVYVVAHWQSEAETKEEAIDLARKKEPECYTEYAQEVKNG